MIGVWATGLFREISSTTKSKDWVENSISKWKLVPTTYWKIYRMDIPAFGETEKSFFTGIILLEILSYFSWNTFLLQGKIVWYNHQHYPHIKTEING